MGTPLILKTVSGIGVIVAGRLGRADCGVADVTLDVPTPATGNVPAQD
jgi:hypothetical protein